MPGDGRGKWRLIMTAPDPVVVPYFPAASDPLGRQGFVRVVNRFDAGGTVHFNSDDLELGNLRLANTRETEAPATVTGIEHGRRESGRVRLSVVAKAACTVTAANLECGNVEGLSGSLGNGTAKWRLRVSPDEPIVVTSVLPSASGHPTNLSTAADRGPY